MALANASANERLAEQSRRLAEQNELLEEQRSRIARTARELQRASALKDRFLAAVSHELRTPMTVILGFTGTLLRGDPGALNAQQQESLERVQRNARLLLGLINDVLDISKIEAGKAEISREVVSVAAAAAAGRDAIFGEAARRKGLSLKTAVCSGARHDHERLREAHADPGEPGRQRAEVHREGIHRGPRGAARARNAGPWSSRIPASGSRRTSRRRSSRSSARASRPTHRGRGGTGLGLAIVRKLALAARRDGLRSERARARAPPSP